MRELLGLLGWFFGPVVIFLTLGLICMALGPLIGVGLVCLIVFAILTDRSW